MVGGITSAIVVQNMNDVSSQPELVERLLR
jgi:hypothetical protein